MVSEETSSVIKAIIAVSVIVLVIAIAWIFFQRIYPLLQQEELTLELKEEAEHKFENFISNIKVCSNAENINCLCEGFSNWPGSFQNGILLTITDLGSKTEINLSYGKNIIKSEVIDSVKFSAVYGNKNPVIFENKKLIDFEFEPPHYIQEGIDKKGYGSKAVISSYFYKSKNRINFIIGLDKEKALELEKLKKCSE